MTQKKFDCVILGGGAAGLFAAVNLKLGKKDLSVLVVEQLQRVGKKLIITGNGRCNITNKNIDISRYHSENLPFVLKLFQNYDAQKTRDIFEKLGVLFYYDDVGRAYPYSLQASSVVDALRFSAQELGVEILTEYKVTDIKNEKSEYGIVTEKGNIYAKTVLVATGLYSGGRALGCDGSVYKILKQKGYKTVPLSPAIVQLKCDPQTVKSLKGIKVNAKVSLKKNGSLIGEDSGEVLFCDYGLSGPPIMQLSRATARENESFKIELNLMPEYSFNEVLEILKKRRDYLVNRSCDEFLTGLLNKRVGQLIIKLSGLKLCDNVSDITNDHIKKMVSKIQNLSFEILSNTGFENSQVTAGGISLLEFYDNMMSKRDKGLFAAGEILDVDGDCGGFNLQWAWSSSLCAANGIIKYLEDKK